MKMPPSVACYQGRKKDGRYEWICFFSGQRVTTISPKVTGPQGVSNMDPRALLEKVINLCLTMNNVRARLPAGLNEIVHSQPKGLSEGKAHAVEGGKEKLHYVFTKIPFCASYRTGLRAARGPSHVFTSAAPGRVALCPSSVTRDADAGRPLN